MKIKGILKMSVILGVSITTLRRMMQHEDFPMDKSEAGCWVFDTDEVLPWFKSRYGYLEGLQNGSAVTASGFKRVLGVSHNTVARWLCEGLPHQKANSTLVVIDLKEAADWLEKRSKSASEYGKKLRELLPEKQR
ncbi:hypothetical protein ACTNDP_17645 [Paenibacillus barengoltzii]|uniref:hypothetical protein n=1 Tax=Paenibacillus barengoltzii TaxID=343517 RepID=UPI003F89E61F